MSGQEQHEVIEHTRSEGMSQRATYKLSGVTRRVAQYNAKQPMRDKQLLKQIKEATVTHGTKTVCVTTLLFTMACVA